MVSKEKIESSPNGHPSKVVSNVKRILLFFSAVAANLKNFSLLTINAPPYLHDEALQG